MDSGGRAAAILTLLNYDRSSARSLWVTRSGVKHKRQAHEHSAALPPPGPIALLIAERGKPGMDCGHKGAGGTGVETVYTRVIDCADLNFQIKRTYRAYYLSLALHGMVLALQKTLSS